VQSCATTDCSPAQSAPGTDAIRITVEHESGYVAQLFVPYCIRDGEVTYEPMFATRTTPSVFT
jgi:hypothetical protein